MKFMYTEILQFTSVQMMHNNLDCVYSNLLHTTKRALYFLQPCTKAKLISSIHHAHVHTTIPISMQASVYVIFCATCYSPGSLSLACIRTLSNGLPKCQMIPSSDTLHPYTLSHAIKLMASAPLSLKFMLPVLLYMYACLACVTD